MNQLEIAKSTKSARKQSLPNKPKALDFMQPK